VKRVLDTARKLRRALIFWSVIFFSGGSLTLVGLWYTMEKYGSLISVFQYVVVAIVGVTVMCIGLMLFVWAASLSTKRNISHHSSYGMKTKPRKYLLLILSGLLISMCLPAQAQATFYYYTETVDGGSEGNGGWCIGLPSVVSEVWLDTGRLKVACSIAIWGQWEAWAYVYKDFYYDGPNRVLNRIEIKYHVHGALEGVFGTASIEIYDEFEDLTSGTHVYPSPHPDWTASFTAGYQQYDHDEYTRFDAELLTGHTYRITLRAKVTADIVTPQYVPPGYASSDFGGPVIGGERYIDWLYLKISQIEEYEPPPGGVTGGGCPILSVWNGTDYYEEGLLDIHNPEGIDLITNHTLVSTPQRLDGAYLMRLTEHPLTHSYIDEVKLYATTENGTTIELPLIWARHSEYGNVLPQLLFSDEWKTETLGAEQNNGTSQSIDLKFAALSPHLKIVSFTFQIEGNNRSRK